MSNKLAQKIISENLKLAYCDYIANLISWKMNGALSPDNSGEVKATKPKWDLHPEGGYMVSTKKTIEMTDWNGKKYKVTVEELAD